MRSIILYALCLALSCTMYPTAAQTVNWESLDKGHIVQANLGAAYGVIYGVGYGYKTGGRLPLLTKLNFSIPSGDQPFDDFAARYGIEMPVLKFNDIRLAVEVQGIYRRFQNELVTAKNFGAEAAISLGIYRRHWFAGVETGFDKAIVTHFQHSAGYKEEFSAVADGWYNPATGGNFNYGLRAGISFKQSDITLRVGNIMAEDFKSKPTLPFYAQLGYNYRISRLIKH